MKFRDVIWAFVGFAIIAASLWGVYFFLAKLWKAFSSLESGVAIAVITATSGIVVTTFTVIISKHLEKKRDIEASFRKTKADIYDDFLKIIFKIFWEASKGKDQNSIHNKLVSDFREFHRSLILWGGPTALKGYSEWYNLIKTEPTSAKAILKMEDFFKCLRKDLGISNRGIKRGAIVSLFVNDIDLLLACYNKNPNVTLNDLTIIKKQLDQSSVEA